MYRLFVLLLGLVLCSGDVNAQIGEKIEKARGQKNIVTTSEKSEYGKNFILITNEEKKGIFHEMWFLDGVCVSVRWMDRYGDFPEDYKKLVWDSNFGNEKVIKKSERQWDGERGNDIHWGKTQSGMNVMVVESRKMKDILLQEARRQLGYENKEDGVRVSFQKQRVYSTDGEWKGTIRNGKIYGTDGTWEGSVRNGNVYGADGTWGGRINGNGQVYNADSQWKGSVR